MAHCLNCYAEHEVHVLTGVEVNVNDTGWKALCCKHLEPILYAWRALRLRSLRLRIASGAGIGEAIRIGNAARDMGIPVG